MKTIMITAPSSNTGKTVVTLGIIRALKDRGLDVSAFKTGPDFIDRKYIGMASGKVAGNLDMHLMEREGLKGSIAMNNGEFGVIEGAMGYFDGIYNTYENSSYDISLELDIPTILVYSPKGEMFSAIPKIKGMVDFSKNRIKGIIFNKTNESMYKLLKEQIEKHIDIEVLGYLPIDEELNIESRHLGLLQPEEHISIEKYINRAACMVENTIDVDKIIKISKQVKVEPKNYSKKRDITVAIAYDRAFNFYYEENIKFLEAICNVEYFSPLKDKELPKADLIYIGGGYPELFLEQLSENMDMIRSIRDYVEDGGYVYGEAGGLMYLVDSIEGYSMCGIFSGKSTMTDRLQRFGYVNILLKEDCMLGQAGDKLTGQEFHRSVIETDEEQILHITKPMSKRKWQCGFSYKNALGIYQHINFLGNEKALDYMLRKIEKDVR